MSDIYFFLFIANDGMFLCFIVHHFVWLTSEWITIFKNRDLENRCQTRRGNIAYEKT